MLAKLALLTFQQSREDEKTFVFEVTDQEVLSSSQPFEINVCNDHIRSLSNRSDCSSAYLDNIGYTILFHILSGDLNRQFIMINPADLLAPSLAATIERMPDPVPTSSTERPFLRSLLSSIWIHSWVVGCVPVPKANPGMISIAI